MTTLEDVCLSVVDCKNRTAPIDLDGEYFVVGTPAMRGNIINYEEARRVNAETFAIWTERLRPEGGDLLFAREAPVGPIVVVPGVGNIAAGQRTMLLRPDPTKTDGTFLRHYLAAEETQARLLSLAHGSTTPHLRVADVRNFLVELPTLSEQRAIAEVLGALDDKIAANTRLAATADALIRARFANLGTESVKQVSDFFDPRREPADPTSINLDTPYVGLEHIPRRSIWLDECGKSATVTSGKSFFTDGDVLFGKLRPYFHKVVSVAFSGICSTDVIVLQPRRDSLAGFGLAAASSDAVVDAVTAASEGTRMPRTSWKDLANVEVPWPGEEAALKFSADVQALRMAIEPVIEQNRTLAATRDSLLPQLIAGNLRVKDAAKTLAEVL